MQNLKRILWRVIRWTLGLFLAQLSLAVIVLLCISYTVGPRPKPEEEWQVYLVIVLELLMIYLTYRIFKSLFKREKVEESVVYSARKPTGETETLVKQRFDQRNPRFVAFFERIHIQKIGIYYLTYFNQQEDGTVYATRWFVFGFLPLIPISVDRIRRSEEKAKVRVPFVVSSKGLYAERLEIHSMPKRLKFLTFLQVYALLLPGMLACAGLLILYFVHPDLGFRNTPAWVYLVVFGGFIGLVLYNEYWHNKRFLRRNFPPET